MMAKIESFFWGFLDVVLPIAEYKRFEVVSTSRKIADEVFRVLEKDLSRDVSWEKISLIGIDLQNDFGEGGSLPVSGGKRVGALFDQVMKQLHSKGVFTILTSDWHPPGHISFASRHHHQPFDTVKVTYDNGVITNQTMWPDHCVQNTKGAEFFQSIRQQLVYLIYRKGMGDIESYSIVTDESKRPASTIVEDLKKQGIQTILIGGLAIDYCVFNSAKDLKAAGFDVYFISKLSAGVSKDTTSKAIKAMSKLGIKVI